MDRGDVLGAVLGAMLGAGLGGVAGWLTARHQIRADNRRHRADVVREAWAAFVDVGQRGSGGTAGPTEVESAAERFRVPVASLAPDVARLVDEFAASVRACSDADDAVPRGHGIMAFGIPSRHGVFDDDDDSDYLPADPPPDPEEERKRQEASARWEAAKVVRAAAWKALVSAVGAAIGDTGAERSVARPPGARS